MNRASVRGSPATTAPACRATEFSSSDLTENLNGKIMEDWRVHPEAAARLIPNQSPLEHFSPSKAVFRSTDNGYTNGSAKLESASSSESLKVANGLVSSRTRRGFALSLGTSMLLSFVSIFFFIGMLGSRNPGYNLRLVPSLTLGGMHRIHRRIQAEFVIDPFKGGIFNQGSVRLKELPVCNAVLEDVVPCYLPLGSSVADAEAGDRHCDTHGKPNQCLVPPPDGYRIPRRWPVSKEGVWHGNMKFGEQLMLSGETTSRLKLGADDIVSLDIGSSMEKHLQLINKAINSANATRPRTILDINCGLSQVGNQNLLQGSSIICLAPYEVNGSRVQFSLERGLPAIIGSLTNRQLPFPSFSFDMIHCLHCSFDWSQKDGLLLLELDRLLKPGGFFVWMSSTEDWQKDKQLANQICWDAVLESDHTVVWRKTLDHGCYTSRSSKAKLKLCGKQSSASSAWYPPLQPCITIAASKQLTQVSETAVLGFSDDELSDMSDDFNVWSAIVKSYWSIMSPLIFSDHPKRPGEEDPPPPANIVHNVMDMNAVHGSLNIALLKARKSVWVMNVVPRSAPNTISTIYEQGLIGVQHDWCEPFPTYPRTYDLLHGIGLLSQELSKPNGCGLSSLFLEMDRILRPEGWVILRDKVELIEDARIAASQMKWDTRVISVEGLEEQQQLVCQKTFWKNPTSAM